MSRRKKRATQFGSVLKSLRLRNGLTLAQFALNIGSVKGSCSGWETGLTAPPSIKFIRKIARFYGYPITVEDLAELAYVEKSPPEIRTRLLHRIADNPLVVQVAT